MKTNALFGTALLMFAASISVYAQPGFGFLYYDGDVIRTVVPPAAAPRSGRDALYPIMGGVEAQLPVTAVAPGDPDYHGGQWAVYAVMWNAGSTPYLLTSEQMVLDGICTRGGACRRMRDADFKCPVQPLNGRRP